jgi:hypothetical protein
MAKTPRTFDPGTVDPIVSDDEVERLDPYDDGPPTGAQHSENHTRRPIKTEADREQGPKTRAANRERMKGSRLFNPR